MGKLFELSDGSCCWMRRNHNGNHGTHSKKCKSVHSVALVTATRSIASLQRITRNCAPMRKLNCLSM